MTGRICSICPYLPGCAYKVFKPRRKKEHFKAKEPEECVHFLEMMRKKKRKGENL